MYQKILEQLKNKYKHLGLSEKVLETMAKKLARRVGEDESKIEQEVTDAAEDLEIYQSFADQNRTLSAEVKKLKEGKDGGTEAGEEGKTDPKTDPKTEPAKDDANTPDWAKQLIESNKALTQKIEGFEKAEKNKTSRQKLVDKLKELKVSESYYETFIDDREFADDAAIDEFAQKLKTSEDKYLETNNLKKLGEAAETKQPESVFSKATDKAGELSSSEQKFVEGLKAKAQPTPQTAAAEAK